MKWRGIRWAVYLYEWNTAFVLTCSESSFPSQQIKLR
jgi:hypothetical protein